MKKQATTGGRKNSGGSHRREEGNGVGPEERDAAHAVFPVVGIGASAGGLAAFEAFFSGMPAHSDPGMAFVLVQHLAPDHKSLLCDLIRRYTRMEVFEVEDGMLVRPNCAYIIPPGRNMVLEDGALQLLTPALPHGQRLPIDFFFRSLARDQRERAIGIVLSGTGSDGTLGVRAIKGEGGLVIAQAPASADFDGMPRSAILTGLVDYELPPEKMGAQLIAYAAHALGRHRREPVPETKMEGAMKRVFILLRRQTGHDFSLYKPGTIHRRLERRMAIHQIDQLDSYVKYLNQSPTEVESLFRDLLIGVTSFFRDPDAFQMLEKKVIPKLFADRPAGSAVRIWVAGCSTGEEAYSIAMLLAEHMEANRLCCPVQIFATDIDSRAVATARSGIYPASIATDISQERMARFFIPEDDGVTYRIQKGIRDLLVFSEQDVVKDPPFSKLNLISCRNLLIYLSPELQRMVIPLFHYALNAGGILFLGTSESAGESEKLFGLLDAKARLYRRKEDGAQRTPLAFPPPLPAVDAEFSQPAAQSAAPALQPPPELADRKISPRAGSPDTPPRDITALKQELSDKEERLQNTLEELRTSTEELQSSNEEMQSVNEELNTVNAELLTKVRDLSRANNDMNNLLAGTGIGTIFLDHQLRILRFTPAASTVINLIPGDVGRPLAHVVSNLIGYVRLVEDTKEVMDTLAAKEVEVQTLAGRYYTLRIQPYRTLDNVIEGAVISFVDITAMVRIREDLKKVEALYHASREENHSP